MKIRIDNTLREVLDAKWCRPGRDRCSAARDLVFAEIISDLESRGDAMRYLDSKGRVAWKATPRLRDYINDLRRDAEADLEGESE